MVTSTHTASGERLEGGYPNGPGNYVQAKYDGAIRSTGSYLGHSALNFFGSGFGKGLLIIALATVAVAAIGGAMAASGGTLAVMGAGGVMTNATIGQGIMIGIGEGITALFSLGGAIAMAAGGVVGTIVENRRKPNEMNLDEAQALAKQYKESREKSVIPTLEAVPEKETTQAKNTAPVESKAEKTCDASFAAREMQRRNELATAERGVA